MGVIASQNFRAVDRLLEADQPQAQKAFESLGGTDSARLLLRYQVGEINRFFFENWGRIQFVLGGGLFLLLLFGTTEGKLPMALTLAMLAVVAISHFGLTPAIVGLGRELDFLPADAESPARGPFRARHSAYAILELVKMGIGAGLTAYLVATHGGRRSPFRTSVRATGAKAAFETTP
jgi:hypothetical protein